MKLSRALFSTGQDSWATPRGLFAELDREFCFTLDPCPLDDSAIAGSPLFGRDGLSITRKGARVFCNPPYSRGSIGKWLAKAREADVAVFLVPARTDTQWWHEHAMKADEIRFIRGRLRFGDAKAGAPFPSVILVYGAAPNAPGLLHATRVVDGIQTDFRAAGGSGDA